MSQGATPISIDITQEDETATESESQRISQSSTRAASPLAEGDREDSPLSAAHRVQLIASIRKARAVHAQLKVQKHALQKNAKNPAAHSWTVLSGMTQRVAQLKSTISTLQQEKSELVHSMQSLSEDLDECITTRELAIKRKKNDNSKHTFAMSYWKRSMDELGNRLLAELAKFKAKRIPSSGSSSGFDESGSVTKAQLAALSRAIHDKLKEARSAVPSSSPTPPPRHSLS